MKSVLHEEKRLNQTLNHKSECQIFEKQAATSSTITNTEMITNQSQKLQAYHELTTTLKNRQIKVDC